MSHVAVIVCGSRHWTDDLFMKLHLEQFLSNWSYATVITGAAPGADTIAHDFALSRPLTRAISIPAFWEHNGKAAGPARNAEMRKLLLAVKADVHMVIGFKNAFDVDMKSGGTENMIGRAAIDGIPAVVLGSEGIVGSWNMR